MSFQEGLTSTEEFSGNTETTKPFCCFLFSCLFMSENFYDGFCSFYGLDDVHNSHFFTLFICTLLVQ